MTLSSAPLSRRALEAAPRILEMRDEGKTRDQVVLELHISGSTVRRVCEMFPTSAGDRPFPLRAVFDQTGWTNPEVGVAVRDRFPSYFRAKEPRDVLRHRTFLTTREAEMVAVAVRYMPDEIWANWNDVSDAEMRQRRVNEARLELMHSWANKHPELIDRGCARGVHRTSNVA